jgi:membrane associated rhomboid family serine protease
MNRFLDKDNVGVHYSFDVSGKNNENFDMSLYIAVPILNSRADTSSINCSAWYGVKYYKSISNRLDKTEKEEKFHSFLDESQTDFNDKELNHFVYLDRIGNSNDHKEYNAAIKKDKRYSTTSNIVLVPVDEPFESRNGDKFIWIFGSFGIGAIVWLIMLQIPKFDEEAIDKFKSGTITDKTDVKSELSIFIPREGFYITPILIDLNIFIFIAMVFAGLGFISFKPVDLLAWGANYQPVTTNGEWWRLLTSTFLHGGLMHLLANMYGLLFVGIFLEPKLGKTKFLVIYLVTGILASISSLYFHEPTVSIGASGAIFGLYGVFLALLLTKVFSKAVSKTFLISTLIFIGYNLLMGFAGAGIDNAAHIGGLLSGFIIGLILYPQLKRDAEEEEMLESIETQESE